MKKNLITLRAPLKLNLQMFAEGGDGGNAGAGASGNEGASAGGEGGNEPQGDGKPATPPAQPAKPDTNTISFKSQTELDSLINTKIQAAQAQWQQNQQQQKDYDKMTPAEKQAFDLKKAQDELAAEKQKTLSLTNKAALNGRLAVDQLPGGLIDVFENVLGADDKTIDAAYTKITGIFRDAVKAGVDAKLTSSAGAPGSGGGANPALSAGAEAAKARNEAHADIKDPWKTAK